MSSGENLLEAVKESLQHYEQNISKLKEENELLTHTVEKLTFELNSKENVIIASLKEEIETLRKTILEQNQLTQQNKTKVKDLEYQHELLLSKNQYLSIDNSKLLDCLQEEKKKNIQQSKQMDQMRRDMSNIQQDKNALLSDLSQVLSLEKELLQMEMEHPPKTKSCPQGSPLLSPCTLSSPISLPLDKDFSLHLQDAFKKLSSQIRLLRSEKHSLAQQLLTIKAKKTIEDTSLTDSLRQLEIEKRDKERLNNMLRRVEGENAVLLEKVKNLQEVCDCARRLGEENSDLVNRVATLEGMLVALTRLVFTLEDSLNLKDKKEWEELLQLLNTSPSLNEELDGGRENREGKESRTRCFLRVKKSIEGLCKDLQGMKKKIARMNILENELKGYEILLPSRQSSDRLASGGKIVEMDSKALRRHCITLTGDLTAVTQLLIHLLRLLNVSLEDFAEWSEEDFVVGIEGGERKSILQLRHHAVNTIETIFDQQSIHVQ